jgi:hypothetical protein
MNPTDKYPAKVQSPKRPHTAKNNVWLCAPILARKIIFLLFQKFCNTTLCLVNRVILNWNSSTNFLSTSLFLHYCFQNLSARTETLSNYTCTYSLLTFHIHSCLLSCHHRTVLYVSWHKSPLEGQPSIKSSTFTLVLTLYNLLDYHFNYTNV